MTQKIIADTETTGNGPDDKVIELAWTEVDDNLNELNRVHQLIDPQRRIAAGASGVHGLTYETVADSPTIEEFFEQVLHPPLEAEVILICHKVDFDRRMLESTFNKYGTRIVGQLCTLRAARRYLKDAENHKLSTLMYQYGLDRGESHRADGDVRTTVSLVRYLCAVSGKSLAELIEQDSTPLIVEKMPFGKHKDKPMTEVPRDYVEWALGPKGLKEIDADLKHTLMLRLKNQL